MSTSSPRTNSTRRPFASAGSSSAVISTLVSAMARVYDLPQHRLLHRQVFHAVLHPDGDGVFAGGEIGDGEVVVFFEAVGELVGGEHQAPLGAVHRVLGLADGSHNV